MGRYATRMEIDDVEDVPVSIEYTAVPFSLGATDGRGGPKISPDEPARIEIEGACLVEDGREITLTTAQEEAMEEEIADWLHGMYDEPEPPNYHDA